MTGVCIISRVIKRIILPIEEPVGLICGKLPVHTAGVVKQKHDVGRCGGNLGVEWRIGDVDTQCLRSAGPITIVTIFIHRIIADFSGAGVDKDVSVIAVAHVNRVTVTVFIDIIRVTGKVAAVTILVYSIFAGFSGTRIHAAVIVIAVVVRRRNVIGPIAVSVIVNVAGGIQAVTILVYPVATYFHRSRIYGGITVVAVAVIRRIAVTIMIYIRIQ